MSSPPRPQPQAPPRLPPSFWHVTALIAALAAVVMLGTHRNALLTAAGLLAAGTASCGLALGWTGGYSCWHWCRRSTLRPAQGGEAAPVAWASPGVIAFRVSHPLVTRTAGAV